MDEGHAQILEIVAEKPGTTAEKITELAADRDITDTDTPDALSEAVSNGDLV
ncbi:hypothetical protein [Natrinema sp. 1APR25-10V2]|uniref:hypothetical protein n=1 Tax=Natrinema sp. 1APR25-10V2 TaxID=2951081 RepID=UPI002876AEDC|nr:hypothetical protein [Natrinema sp. 1APR25-10V2]MDS0476892.1 hypothetical protein [Natrinema sp. 1APR25-10V2]